MNISARLKKIETAARVSNGPCATCKAQAAEWTRQGATMMDTESDPKDSGDPIGRSSLVHVCPQCGKETKIYHKFVVATPGMVIQYWRNQSMDDDFIRRQFLIRNVPEEFEQGLMELGEKNDE
jgi:hypothetical protein